MGDRGTDHAEKFRRRVNPVPPIQLFELADGQLPRRRGMRGVRTGKGRKAAKFFRQKARYQPRLSHAQDNRIAILMQENIDRVETIVYVSGRIDQFWDRLIFRPDDSLIDICRIRKWAVKLVSRKDQSRPVVLTKRSGDFGACIAQDEIIELAIDEIGTCADSFDQYLCPQFQRHIGGTALGLVPAGHDHGQRRLFGRSQNRPHLLDVKIGKIIRAQLQHLGAGLFSRLDPLGCLVNALSPYRYCKISHNQGIYRQITLIASQNYPQIPGDLPCPFARAALHV